MYRTNELVGFTLEEFRRGLEGLTDEEALVRHPKADGSTMNAASWIVQHVSAQWDAAHSLATGEPRRVQQPPRDGTPPPWAETLAAFEVATEGLNSLEAVTDEQMSASHPVLVQNFGEGEGLGTYIMRGVLHTWFHAGEINAIRQLHGHEEIRFVGRFEGRLRWVAEHGLEGR
jgi:hypothetical protein